MTEPKLELDGFQKKIAAELAEWLPEKVSRDLGDIATSGSSTGFKGSTSAFLGEEARATLKALGVIHWDEEEAHPQVLHWTNFGQAVGEAALDLYPQDQ